MGYLTISVLTKETAKLIRRFIFFFALIFLIRQLVIEQHFLAMTPLEVGLWLSPYLAVFVMGALVAVGLIKFSTSMLVKYKALIKPIAFTAFHQVAQRTIMRGIQSSLMCLLYFALLFFTCWFVFSNLLAAVLTQIIMAVVVTALLLGVRHFGASLWVLHRPPIWGMMEVALIVPFYATLVMIVIFLETEANASVFILVILVPRQFFASVIAFAQTALKVWYPKGCIQP